MFMVVQTLETIGATSSSREQFKKFGPRRQKSEIGGRCLKMNE
jgi:hypothetical protein